MPAEGRETVSVVEYSVHGVRLVVETDWKRLLTLLGLNFGGFPTVPQGGTELRVAITMRQKPWLSPRTVRGPVVASEGQTLWGEGLVTDGRGVRFHSGGVDVEYVPGPPASVRATYILDRRNRLAGIAGEVPRWEEVQKVMRLAVYLPLFHLWELSGKVVLHAAAVAGPKGAVVLSGLNGSGKSTLCFQCLDPLAYMSDNYVILSGDEVLAFPESLRLPIRDGTTAASGPPSVWGKRLVVPDWTKVVMSARPRALVFVGLGVSTSLVPLSPAEGARRLAVIQDMTAEFPRYGFLGPISPAQDGAPLKALTHSVPSYALTVADAVTARRRILELAGAPDHVPEVAGRSAVDTVPRHQTRSVESGGLDGGGHAGTSRAEP